MSAGDPTASRIDFVLLTSAAVLPRKASAGAAGFDLFSAEDVLVLSNNRRLIQTDVAVRLPPNCYGEITGRSSNNLAGYVVVPGIVDEDYTGSLGIVLHNQTNGTVRIAKGIRIGQLICKLYVSPVTYSVWRPWDESTAPQTFATNAPFSPDDTRGSRGFGSTGGGL